jgi:putative tricarboxylic transport membrane protein
MGRGDRISGFFWLAFGAFMTVESYRLGLGTLHQPGPGFLFFWAGLALFFMSIALLIQAWTRKERNQTEAPIFGKQNTKKIILFSISVFLYAFLLDELGFILVTLLLFLFLLGVLEKKKWIFTVWVSVVVTAVTYLIFETWLQSQLPRGILDSLRF